MFLYMKNPKKIYLIKAITLIFILIGFFYILWNRDGSYLSYFKNDNISAVNGSNATVADTNNSDNNTQVLCRNLFGEGDLKKKINFLFVAENFTNKNDFISQVNTYLGLNGNDPLSLFQYSPFNEFKNSYTVRYQFIPNKDYECADSNSVVPNDKRFCFNNTIALQTFALSCGESAYDTDFIVVLSKKSFRSSSDSYTLEEIDPRTRIVRVSVAVPENTPPEKMEVVMRNAMNANKKTLLHEFGHALGMLSDEYIAYDKKGYKPIAGTRAANIDTAGCPKWSSGQMNTLSPHYGDYITYQSCIANLNTVDSRDDSQFKACYANIPPEAFEQDFSKGSRIGSGCYWGAGAVNGFRSIQTSIMRNPGVTELGLINEGIARVGIKKLIESRNLPINTLNIVPSKISLLKTTLSTDGRSKQYQFRLEFDVLNQQKKHVLIRINRHNYDLSASVNGKRVNVITSNPINNNYYAYYDHVISIKDHADLNLVPSDEIIMVINAIYNTVSATKSLKINLANLKIENLKKVDFQIENLLE